MEKRPAETNIIKKPLTSRSTTYRSFISHTTQHLGIGGPGAGVDPPPDALQRLGHVSIILQLPHLEGVVPGGGDEPQRPIRSELQVPDNVPVVQQLQE